MDDKIAAQLESMIEVSHGLAIFRFRLQRDFLFEAGQYATLWLTHNGKTIARPYTIASSPSEKRHIELYINLVQAGKLTPSLFESDVIESLRSRNPDTIASITGPKGIFVLDPEDFRDLVWISSGTGLAPFISMIRKLNEDFLRSEKAFHPRCVYLIHGVSYPSHLGYREELERLAAVSLSDPKRSLSLLYLPTVSRPCMNPTWTGLTGRAETILVPSERRNGAAPDLAETVKEMLAGLMRPSTHVVYVCGHPGTVDTVANALSWRGFRLDVDIKQEKYYP
jgi:NAD(P)H-flavin reductase